MKSAASLLRQKSELLRAELVHEEPHSASASPSSEREVDLFERRPPHLEPLELLAARERLRVSSCSTRVGSLVRTTISSPSRR